VHWYLENYKMPPMVFTPDGDFPVVNTEKGRAPIVVTCPPCDHAQGAEIVSIKGGTVANAVPGTAEAVVRFISAEQAQAAVTYCSIGGVTYDYEEISPLDIKFTSHGVAAHASMPEDGENAICGLLNLLTTLPLADSAGHDAIFALNDAIPYGDYEGEAFGGKCSDEESGPLTVNLGTIEYTPETGLKAVIDMRVPVCGDSPAICTALQDKLGEYAQTEMAHFSKPHQVPSDSPFVKGLMEIYNDYTGLDGKPMSMGGGTYVHNIEGGVAFGCTMPGRKPKMHEPDENMPVEDLKLASAMFAEAIVKFCG
jgi:succinyl-diaminopimelate desuccinylase